ncbi:phage late control D family protein [Limnofasciculus baicalensis]|uniref:Contractile injection system protein, VgrG/Pvc8 family n=1 Tax=Limnofasciculus baicalensis BBK-W-15 TaxID=2699891 RepID=A0AAE3GSU8_9CYAN|nr:contractile injection system protein, VgrG/Pvc8 family [Limnofasciculus baicalensis]MCP2729168.1 contractile injection system protein, VgrG/Pvc8 family [Limnofasciculus baicalensis BBK-W-15]
MSEPKNAEKLSPKLNIKINGEDLDLPAKFAIQKVEVSEDLEAVGMFSFQIIAWDMVKNKVTWIDSELFNIGNLIEIQMGYHNFFKTLIVGEIIGLEPEFSQESPSMLVVRGYDLGHRLMRGRKTRSFRQMKDSSIVEQIARDLSIAVKVEDTKIKSEYVLQHNQTDWEFIQDRAKRIGYEVILINKTLNFRAKQNNKAKVLTLKYPDDLLDFSPRLSTIAQAGEVEIRAWDFKEKKAIVDRTIADNEKSTMGKTSGAIAVTREFGRVSQSIVTQPVHSKEEAKQIALGQYQEMALTYITGEGSCLGNPDLRAGQVIEITGIGERFSGLYYVTATTHTYGREEGYQTQFTVKRDATNY